MTDGETNLKNESTWYGWGHLFVGFFCIVVVSIASLKNILIFCGALFKFIIFSNIRILHMTYTVGPMFMGNSPIYFGGGGGGTEP